MREIILQRKEEHRTDIRKEDKIVIQGRHIIDLIKIHPAIAGLGSELIDTHTYRNFEYNITKDEMIITMWKTDKIINDKFPGANVAHEKSDIEWIQYGKKEKQ